MRTAFQIGSASRSRQVEQFRSRRMIVIAQANKLPGVGQNFQDHFAFTSRVWECQQPVEESGNVGQAFVFWKSDPSLETPDVQIFQGLHSEVAKLQTSADSMMMAPSIVRPKSRGHLRLTGPNPLDPIEIHANILGDPGDLKAMTTAIELCRDIADFSSFLKREITPGSLKGSALEQIVRNSVSTIGTRAVRPRWDAIPCRSSMAILRFYGIEKLRIADGSIMPRLSTGNTMAPCVVIGERCAEILKTDHL
jgi:choline dehydrogenase